MIVKALDLSTGHIKEKTNSWLHEHAPTHDQMDSLTALIGVYPRYVRHDYGYIIFVSSDILANGGYQELYEAAPELFAIIVYAIANDCAMINLDRDGELIDSLEKFEWK